jgi:NADPH:quinone reductase-like Zn-dependent oxidoreductase
VDSTAKLDMLRSIGADHVIDYTREDFAQRGERYDAIFDVVGKAPFAGSMRSLSKNGVYLLANPSLSRLLRGRWTSLTSSKRVISGASSPQTADLLFLKELIESGTLRVVIDRRFPLEQMAEAHRYVEAGGKKGNVVITVAPEHGT